MNPLNPFATPGTASPRALALVMSLGPGGAGGIFVGLVFLVVGSLFSSVFCGGLPQDAGWVD